MRIAVPVDDLMMFYHFNPLTAPKFALFSINEDNGSITFRLNRVVENPWINSNQGNFEKSQVACSCALSECSDMQHISEHYALLDAIGGCHYLLVDRYCENITRALKNGGIEVYRIPPIINNINFAVKNFILGASLASTFKHIHYAS